VITAKALRSVLEPNAKQYKDVIGPRPTREQLKSASQIPGFTPTNKKQALYAGADTYVRPKDGEVMGITELGNTRNLDKAGDPLSAAGSKSRAKRRTGRNKMTEDGMSQRDKNIFTQTEGDDTFYKGFDSEGKTVEAHHSQGLDQYRPFFEGLSKEDGSKLRSMLKKEGIVLGNKLENRLSMPKDVHDAFHNGFERSHNIKIDRYKFAGDSLEERLDAAKLFYQTIQKAYDEAAYELMNRWGKGASRKELLEIARSF